MNNSLKQAQDRARALIQAPSNRMTPALFAEECRTLEKQGVEVTIYDRDALQKLGAEAILAVGKGSSNPPCMVVLHYKNAETKPIALVGKGVCFDAGGLHLKRDHLCEMKWDKAGAGAVFGAIDALSRSKTKANVVGVLPLAENIPGPNAMRPGDIINTLSDQTVEIVDTDCEGRLLLADALTYVQGEYDPEIIIDIATLTLETFGALGSEYAGLFTPDKELETLLHAVGEETRERVWPLPLGRPYTYALASPFADLRNAGLERYGASSFAAEFLRAFIEPNRRWAHLDIAGTAWNLQQPEKGVTGFGVALLYSFIRRILFTYIAGNKGNPYALPTLSNEQTEEE